MCDCIFFMYITSKYGALTGTCTYFSKPHGCFICLQCLCVSLGCLGVWGEFKPLPQFSRLGTQAFCDCLLVLGLDFLSSQPLAIYVVWYTMYRTTYILYYILDRGKANPQQADLIFVGRDAEEEPDEAQGLLPSIGISQA